LIRLDRAIEKDRPEGMIQELSRPITRQKLRELWARTIRIARFDKDTFRELKEDKSATGQAVAVLLLVGLFYGLGYSIFTGIQKSILSPNYVISQTLANMIITDFAVFVWSATVFLVGTKLFQGKTGYWELARPLFFSTAPGILFVLIAIPLWPIIVATAVVASAWIVSAEFVALKSAMGFNTQRALLTSVVGLLILIFIQMTI
jgi:hypothetical protein